MLELAILEVHNEFRGQRPHGSIGPKKVTFGYLENDVVCESFPSNLVVRLKNIVDNLNSLVLIAKVDRTHDLFERQVTAVAKTLRFEALESALLTNLGQRLSKIVIDSL
jgi:hypothetical protein